MIGKTLAHYEITAHLGTGGMGEVYRATDTHLGRDVALKLLPTAVTRDPERVARFEREARTLASLHHPQIASLFGFEEADGFRFLIMELVEGEDLQQHLRRGPMPLDEAITMARQVARGLEAAHEKSIVHRDLKPANIKLAADGQAKILDFGLARAYADEPNAQDLEHSPTITAGMTQAGAIMGTAAYMSPEQAKGKEVDKRTDVFAFGCVLYESLTGRQTFPGDSVTDVLASVLRSDPDMDALPAGTPSNVRDVIRRCLEKDPRNRLRDIGDVELLLRDTEEEQLADTQVAEARKRGWVWPAVAGVLALACVGLFLRGGSSPHSAPHEPIVTGMTPLTDLPGLQLDPSLSPDGRQLLYTSVDGGDQDIFLQRVGGENALNLTADSPGLDVQARFSPDGERIAFVSDRNGRGIFVMGATGETPRRVTNEGYDPDWSPDGTKLVYTTELVTDSYSRNGLANLHVVDLESGNIELLDDIDAAGPCWSPNGHRIAFWTHLEVTQGQRDIWTIGANGGAPLPVLIDIHTDWDPVWSADGRYIYFCSDRGGTPDVWRIAVDELTGVASGDPEPVTLGMASISQMSPIRNGRMAAVSQARTGAIVKARFDPAAERLDGELQTLHTSAYAFRQMGMSADKQWLTFYTSAPTERVYMMSVDGQTLRKLVDDEFRNRGPTLSPDGRWATFYSNRSGTYGIWAIRTDGTGTMPLTDTPEMDINSPTWGPDGRLFVVIYAPEPNTSELLLPDGGLNAVTSPPEFTLLPGAENFSGYAWSPNGKWLVGMLHSAVSAGFYSVDTQQLTELTRDSRALRPDDTPAWLDDNRMLMWDEEAAEAIVYQVDTGETRPVPRIPGPSHYQFGPAGQTIYINHEKETSDVWLLSLGDPD